MKYKANYTKDDYIDLIVECSVLEAPNQMVDIDKTLRNLNKVLSITDENEFPEIWQARHFLLANPQILVQKIYKNIAGPYTDEILGFLNSLVVIYRITNVPSVLHYGTNNSLEWYIMTCYLSISKINTTNLAMAGVLQDINLFSFILCHISKFKEFHHFDIFGRKI